MKKFNILLFTLFRKNSQEWRTRYSKEWRKLRKDVLKRDNYRCQNPSCNKKQTIRRRLAVHHIEDASSNPTLILEESNLISLCHGKGKCHNNFHKWNGGFDKPCNSKQLKRWFFIQEKGKRKSLIIWLVTNTALFIFALMLSIVSFTWVLIYLLNSFN